MTTPADIPQLLSPDDLALFQAADPDWFLNAAGEIVRGYCQWHIAPPITVTDTVPIQPDGTILLPTLYLTDVTSIVIDGITLDPATYTPYLDGSITRQNVQQPYFEYPLWPLESDRPFREYPSAIAFHADVTYTHGYPTLPVQVETVAFELVTRAMELPAGLATQISAGPQSISFGAIGLVLNAEERRRLGPYSLTGKRF
jgi:hypothetical protein